MAVLNALQVASGPLADLGFVEEVSYGQVPVAPVLKVFRRRSTTLGLTKDVYQSEEIRSDRMVSDSRHGVRRSGGDVVTELSPKSHSEAMAALLGGFWQKPADIVISTTGLTATLVNGLLEVVPTTPPYNFVTSGFLTGSTVTFAGTGSVALNGTLFSVVSHTTNKIRLLPPVGFVLAAPAALVAGTFGLKGARVPMGNIYRSYTFERAFTDIGSFIVFTGERVGSMAVDLPATGIATATYSFVGKDALPIAAASIDGVSEVILTDSTLTSLTFDAALKTITAGAGSFVTAGIAVGDRVLISGTGITAVQNRNPRTVLKVTATVLTVAEAIQSGSYVGPFEVLRVGLPQYTDVSDNPVLVAVSGVLLINGVPAATVTGMSFSVDNQNAGSEVVGSNVVPVNLFGNQCVISGSVSVLFDRGGIGEDLYNAFDRETDNMSVVMRLDTPDGLGGLAFVFPRVKFGSGAIGDAAANGLPVTAEFTALKPPASKPELGKSQIYIYDSDVVGVVN